MFSRPWGPPNTAMSVAGVALNENWGHTKQLLLMLTQGLASFVGLHSRWPGRFPWIPSLIFSTGGILKQELEKSMVILEWHNKHLCKQRAPLSAKEGSVWLVQWYEWYRPNWTPPTATVGAHSPDLAPNMCCDRGTLMCPFVQRLWWRC